MNPAFGGSNPSAPALDDLLRAWARRDPSAAVAAFSPDGLFVGSDGSKTRGRAALGELFERFLAGTRPWHFTPEAIVPTHGGFRVRYRFSIGRPDGSFEDRPGVAAVIVRDGSIDEWRESGVIMAQDTLTIDLTTTDDGHTQMYVLRGSLDIATSPSLRAALLEAAEHKGHRILVDLTNVEFLDSTGLGALIGAHKRAIDFDGSVRLIVQEGQILRLLRITGLLDVFHVYPTIDAALADDERLVGL